MPVVYSEPYKRYRIQCFAKIVNTKKLLTIFAKCSILDVPQSSEFASGCQNIFFSPIFIISKLWTFMQQKT